MLWSSSTESNVTKLLGDVLQHVYVLRVIQLWKRKKDEKKTQVVILLIET